jgi:hypothetical protein
MVFVKTVNCDKHLSFFKFTQANCATTILFIFDIVCLILEFRKLVEDFKIKGMIVKLVLLFTLY